jgi:hypothetical protein
MGIEVNVDELAIAQHLRSSPEEMMEVLSLVAHLLEEQLLAEQFMTDVASYFDTTAASDQLVPTFLRDLATALERMVEPAALEAVPA